MSAASSAAPVSAQSNSRQALAAIMGTVQITANTVSSTFVAANKSIGMLNKLVSDAAARQEIRSSADQHIFKATIHQEKAQELCESRRRIDDYIAQSSRHKDLYEAAFNELATVLNPVTP